MKNTLLAALLGAALALGVAHADEAQDIARMIKAGQLDAALQRADAFLATHPRDAQMRFVKGLVLTEQNKTNDAIAVFLKLTEDFPELPEPYNNLAVLYASQAQYEKARAALEMAIRTHPSYATAHENLGDIYSKLASEAYSRALQYDSGNSAAQSKLTLIRELIGGGTKPVSQPQVATATPAPAKAAPAPAAPAAKAEPKGDAGKAGAPPAAAKGGSDEDEIRKAVQAWAAAWARQDVEAYLASYASDFQTPAGEARKKWESDRRARIVGKKHIEVRVENIAVKVEGSSAIAKFRQYYKGDSLETKGSKALTLKKANGKWVIQQEKSGADGVMSDNCLIDKFTATCNSGSKVSFLKRWVVAAAATAILASAAAPAGAEISAERSREIESALAAIYGEISQNRMANALKLTDALIANYQNFRLAYLIRGDLLIARSRPMSKIGEASGAPEEKLRDLREEALVRLRSYREKPPANAVPRYLLQLRADQKAAVVVDTKKSRLYVYENANGRPRFVADYYFTQGKEGDQKTREGDQKTPIGVYHITSSLPKAKLADLYGAGALPINYPNEWDRRLGHTGSGIWLHGTPKDTYSRPPKSSDGCVVLSNPDFEALFSQVQVGLTPVIISEKIEWLSLDDWNAERQALVKAIEDWRRDWETLDTPKYLSHYSRKFASEDLNFNQWAERKRRVNGGKEWAKISVDNVSMLRYPGKDDMVVVSFDQNYRSSNLSGNSRKRQYWIREDGRWRILYEGTA